MGFGIQLNNVWVKLKEDSTLSSTQFSQLVNESKLKGAFTIPMDIPIAGNEVFFGNMIQMKGINAGVIMKTGFSAVKVYINNVWWLSGKLRVLRINEESLSINLILGLPGISSLDTKLQDLGWNTITLPTDADPPTELALKLDYFKTRMLGEYDATDVDESFNFPPVQNLGFYGENKEKNLDWAGLMNGYADGAYISNLYGNYNAIVPMLYQLEILRKGFTQGGYAFITTNLPDDFKKIIQYSNYDLVKMRNSFGVLAFNNSAVSSIDDSGSDFIIPYDNDDPGDGYWDDSGLWDTGTFEYTIKRPGKYLLRLRNLQWVASDYAPVIGTGVLSVIVEVQNGTIASESTQFGNFAATNTENFDVYIDVLEDGTCNGTYAIDEKIRINLFYRDADHPANTALVGAGGTIQIINLTRPQLNYFADSIDLSKCVPQDVLFRDFVNAFAATWNVEFVIDEIFKTITAKPNDTSIAAEPDTKDSIWQSHAEKPIIEIRAAKYKDMCYDWSGADTLVAAERFRTWDVADWLGESETFKDVLLDFAPDLPYLNKKVSVWNEGIVYECIANADTGIFEWVFYSNYFAAYAVGGGTDTLKLPISPLMMTHRAYAGFTMAVPDVTMEANSQYFKLTEKDTGLRMFIFYNSCEFALDLGGVIQMPYSSTNSFEYKPTGGGAYLVPELSMDYYAEHDSEIRGIYLYWEYTLRMLNLVRKITKKLNLRMDEFINYSFRKRVYMGGAVLMPEQLSMGIRLNETHMEIEAEFGIEEVELL